MPCAYQFKQGHRIRLETVNGDTALTETPFFVHQYHWCKVGVDTITPRRRACVAAVVAGRKQPHRVRSP